MSYWQQTKIQNSSGTVIDPATSTKQSDGTQKTQIVDGSGNVISSTTNYLNVQVAAALPAGTNLLGKVGIDQTTPGTTNAVAAKLIDQAGTPYGIRQIDNKPRVSSMPYLYDIAEGSVSGHTFFDHFGFNGDIDITEEDLWPSGGTFVPIASAAGLELVSTSVEDDPDKGGAVAGTGIHTVTIYYLQADFSEHTEDINLDGTTVVPTVALDIFRVQRIKAKVCGTGKAAAGTISIRHLTDTPVYNTIEVGQTQSRNSFYTVPDGKVLYVTSMFVGCASGTATNGARVILRATYDRDAAALRTFFLPHAEVTLGSNGAPVCRNFELPLSFPEGTDLKISASSIANNAMVDASMRGWLETA